MSNINEYYRPQELEEALDLLAQMDIAVAPLGGGSDLIAHRQGAIEAVVDLRSLGLKYLRREGDTLLLGAAATLQMLIDSPESAHAWNDELAQAISLTAIRNLREVGTIAGTLVSAALNNPLAVMLIALNATVTLKSRIESPPPMPIDDFLAQRESQARGTLLTEVTIPLPHSGEAVALEKVSRTPADLPIVCAAVKARREGGALRDVRIGLGGVGSRPLRAARIESILEGRAFDRSAIEAAMQGFDPPADFMGSAEYRREMAVVLISRAARRL